MASPIKYPHPNEVVEDSPTPSKPVRLCVAARRGAVHHHELERKEGTWGVAAARTYDIDMEAAAAANHAPELYGTWHGPPKGRGSRYFRRREAFRGTELKPNTYPALQLPRGHASVGAQRFVEQNTTQHESSSSSSGGGHHGESCRAEGSSSSSNGNGNGSSSGSGSGGSGGGGGATAWPGAPRTYTHGGMDPTALPGQFVPVKVSGQRVGKSLMPLVNFGPAELLQYNFS